MREGDSRGAGRSDSFRDRSTSIGSKPSVSKSSIDLNPHGVCRNAVESRLNADQPGAAQGGWNDRVDLIQAGTGGTLSEKLDLRRHSADRDLYRARELKTCSVKDEISLTRERNGHGTPGRVDGRVQLAA